MIEFFDDDPDEIARRLRLKAGFKRLADDMQATVDAEMEIARQRARQLAEKANARIAEQQGFFMPEGGEIEISPTLAAILHERYGWNVLGKDDLSASGSSGLQDPAL